MYSDASELSIKNNRIELIEEGAFDASVRKFDFIGERGHISSSAAEFPTGNRKVGSTGQH